MKTFEIEGRVFITFDATATIDVDSSLDSETALEHAIEQATEGFVEEYEDMLPKDAEIEFEFERAR